MKLPTGKTRSDSMAKKMSSGHEPRHRDRAPAGSRLQDGVQALDVGNAGVRQLQQVDPVEEGRHDARAEQLDLPREQQVPHRMVLGGEGFPALRDDIVLPILPELARGDLVR